TPVVRSEDPLVGEVSALSFSFSLIGHPRLPFEAPTFVAVAAFDGDGEGPLSAEAQGIPRQASIVEIAAETVLAFEIEAEQINAYEAFVRMMRSDEYSTGDDYPRMVMKSDGLFGSIAEGKHR